MDHKRHVLSAEAVKSLCPLGLNLSTNSADESPSRDNDFCSGLSTATCCFCLGEGTRPFWIRNKNSHHFKSKKAGFRGLKILSPSCRVGLFLKKHQHWLVWGKPYLCGWVKIPRFLREKILRWPKNCTLETSFSWPTSLHSTVALTCQSKNQLQWRQLGGMARSFWNMRGTKLSHLLEKT